VKLFSYDRVVIRTHAARPELGEKSLEIDAEVQGFRRVMEVQAIDKERQFFGRKHRPSSLSRP
jgi:hypothetical protein